MYLIDTHAHLYLREFDDDRETALERAEEAGVHRIYLPNIDMESISLMMDMASAFPDRCFPMMGLHPCSVKEDYGYILGKMETELTKRNFHGIGETGLDHYWDKTFSEQQREALLIQIGWAKQYRLPIVLHCREAFHDLISMIEENHDENLSGVFHCFTGTPEDARRVMNLGRFYMGIGGVITYRKSGLAETVGLIGPDRLVLETDAPYLAPAPHRGKRNESAYLPLVLARLSEALGMPETELAEVTSANATRLFQLPEQHKY